jgi:hypothetical protein
MRQPTRPRKKRAGMGIVLLGVAGLACLLAGWTAGGPQVAVLSASEAIALRFPDSGFDAWDNVGALRTTYEVDDQAELFRPTPTLVSFAPAVTTVTVRQDRTSPAPAALASLLDPAQALPAALPAKPEITATLPKSAAVAVKPAPQPAPRARPGAVLNDAQIASIKSRLRLTPEQREMWPAVEVALRDLSFDKKSGDGGRKVTAYANSIDPTSSEVQRLKSVAFPLIMSFSDEQKRELRIIAHVAGLEKLAAQF